MKAFALVLVTALLAAAGHGAAVGATGGVLAREPRPAGTVIWQEKIPVAAGGGHRGPWRMNESDYDYVDDPTVALSAEGVIGVAWADQARQDIFFQRYGPDGQPQLAAPVNVSRSPRVFSWLPRMALAGREASEVLILWQEIVFSGGSHGGEIFFARSGDGGRTFSRPVNLSNTIAGAGKGRLDPRRWDNGSLDLARGPQGHLHAAWTEYEGALWVSRSTDGGRSFGEPMRIAGGDQARPARGPALAAGAGGAVHLAWTVGEDPAADIRVATSRDGGRSFGAPAIVSASGGHADAPKIAVDRTGTLHVVYAESPGGPFGRYHIRYTRSTADRAAFEAPREIAAPPPGFASVHFPALGVDGADNLYVIWELFPGRDTRSLGLGVTSSTDRGATFASPAVVPGSADRALGFNGSQQGRLMRKLAVNGSGALAVVNSTFRSNEGSRVWLWRGQAAAR